MAALWVCLTILPIIVPATGQADEGRCRAALRSIASTFSLLWRPAKRLTDLELTTDSYASLRDRPLAEYFSEAEKDKTRSETEVAPSPSALLGPNGRPLTDEMRVGTPTTRLPVVSSEAFLSQQLLLDPSSVETFLRDFSQLTEARRRLQGLSRYSAFLKWWKENQSQYLTRPVIEAFLQNGATMGQFLDHLHLRYLASELANRRANPVYRVSRAILRHPALSALAVPIVFVTGKLLSFLWQLTVLGPGVQMVNSYTEPIVQPLTFGAKQQGAVHFQTPAQMLQELLSGRQELAAFKEELEVTTRKLNAMSPEEAKEHWHELELEYFRVFQKYQQVLPAHLRDGRFLYRDFVISTPVFLASALSTFDVQYWMHRDSLDRVNREIASRQASGGLVSEELLQRKKAHEDQITATEDRIASTLAGWKLYEFMFPEFSRNNSNSTHRASMHQAYETFKKEMHFEIYQKHFGHKMQQVLEELDLQLALQAKIESVAYPVPSVASPTTSR